MKRQKLHEKLVDHVAKALCRVEERWATWDHLLDEDRDYYRRLASVALNEMAWALTGNLD